MHIFSVTFHTHKYRYWSIATIVIRLVDW